MKISKPATEVEVCDYCKRENQYLQVCWSCGKQFCLGCEAVIPDSYGFTAICRDCGARKDVLAICARYAKRLSPIFQERNSKLKKLRKKAEAGR